MVLDYRSILLFTLGASIAEIVSAFPTSGGLYTASAQRGTFVPVSYFVKWSEAICRVVPDSRSLQFTTCEACDMAKSYRVFIGSPSPNGNRTVDVASWRTVSMHDASLPLAPTTLEQAEHKISLVYENVIFNDANCLEGSSDDDFSLHTGNCSATDLSLSKKMKESDCTGDETTMLSEGSSISRFPTFNFSLSAVSSLSSILQAQKPVPVSSEVTLLLGVLEVDGPNYVKVKTGQYAGSEVALLKLVVGDESGAICKLIAWRETAELWGGLEEDSSMKRGDIILVEKIMVSGFPYRKDALDNAGAKLQLTASPNLKSQAQICYRTLPESYEDQRLRPDLRLSDSVPAVRKVREVVIWMETMAGIAAQL